MLVETSFRLPVVLPESRPVARPEGGNARSVRSSGFVLSVFPGSGRVQLLPRSSVGDAAASAYMQGQLCWGAARGGATQVPAGEPGSADRLRSHCRSPVQWSAVYGWLAGGGLQYGTRFQPLRGVSMCSSKGWMSGRSEWGVPGHASTELCNEGGFHVHPVPLDGSMQLGAGASLGATPKQGTSPDAPSAPRVPAAVRGFGVDKRQSYLNSWRGSGLTAWAGVSDSSDDAGVGESSHSLFTAWGGSLCSIRSLVVRELKASAVPRTAGLSTSGKPEAVAAEAATEMYTVAWQTQSPLETALPHPGGVLSAEPGAWTAWGTGTSMQSRNIWKGFSAGHGPFSPPLWSSMRVLCAFPVSYTHLTLPTR